MIWTREQAEERLVNLEDTLIDLKPVLEQFPPNHVHWLEDKALFFRMMLSINRIPGKISEMLFYPTLGLNYSAEQFLRFKENDFEVPTTRKRLTEGGGNISWRFFLNTTKVEDSIYQVFTDSRRNYKYTVGPEGQDIINTMLAAQVYTKSS